MSNFPDITALRVSLRDAGMDALAERIVATVRPTILFLRRQESDASLPCGCSKIGGLPDLPEAWPWPERPARADAVRRTERLRELLAQAEDPRALSGGAISADLVEMYEQMAAGENAEVASAARGFLEQMRSPSSQDDALRRSRIAWLQACIEAVHMPMPLAFVAQLDLAALSAQPGFDPLLPRSGVLSIFVDMTEDEWDGCGHRVYWHDVDAGGLLPRQPPPRLRQWYDSWDAYGFPRNEAEQWARLSMAERLYPFSGISVPYHWQSAFTDRGADWQAVWNWFHGHDAQALSPRPAQDDTAPGAYFGDKLGGWPEDIQDHVEDEVAGNDGERITVPGRTSWRQLFSYGGEYYAGTRRMPGALGGDGQHYLMIREEDLLARRFQRVRDVYQCT